MKWIQNNYVVQNSIDPSVLAKGACVVAFFKRKGMFLLLNGFIFTVTFTLFYFKVSFTYTFHFNLHAQIHAQLNQILGIHNLNTFHLI